MMQDAPFSLTVRPDAEHNATVLELEGPLVIAGMFQLQTALREQTTPLTVIDLSAVPYMDSSGMGAILNGYVSAEKAGRKVVVSGVSERVRALFELTRVQTIIKMYPDVEQALQDNAAR